jgi:phospholipase/lecithinase/hemolysin
MRALFSHARAVILASAICVLSGCGGSGGSNGSGASTSPGTAAPPGGISLQVVSFGDSLSDVGTYAPLASAVGGGRFTTNPGQVWTQDVAQYYGDTLSAAYTIDATHKLSARGGLGYAEGGATIAMPASQSPFLTQLTGDIEMPVTEQVSSFLASHGSFASNQLALIWAGANNVLRAGQLPAAAPIVQAAANGLAQLGPAGLTGALYIVRYRCSGTYRGDFNVRGNGLI